MLYVLRQQSGQWEAICEEKKEEKFLDLYKKVVRVMDLAENKLTYPKKIELWNGDLMIEILRVENHSLYDVVYLMQYNKQTNGLRFLAYGRNKQMDSSISNKKTLNQVTKDEALEHCPYDHSTIAIFI